MFRYLLLIGAMASLIAASADSRHWTLATDDTRIELTVAADRPVVTHLRASNDSHDWAAAPMPVPLMAKAWLGTRECSLTWVFEQATENRAQGTVTLAFTCADPALGLRSIWRARPGRGPIEHWLEIENRSGQPVAISQQESLGLAGLDPGAEADVWWTKRGGSNATTEGGTLSERLRSGLSLDLVSNCEDGTSPVPWLAVQVGEKRGLYVGWEFSGLGRIAARGAGPQSLGLSIGLMPDFKTDIAPGEVFEVPPAFIGCYTGDLDAGSYGLHRFVTEKLRPPMPPRCPDPILAYNPYLDSGCMNATEATLLKCAHTCRDLQFEAFMPDAMWFPQTGDWRWDAKRFPRGADPIVKYVHDSGMRMALWCAWTNAGASDDPGALSVRGPVGHPDWFSGDVGPDWQPGPFWGAQLCLASPEGQKWAVAKTQWLVHTYGLDYLKHDCGPIVINCNKTTHRHHYGTDVSYWATRGYYDVQEKLRAACPGVILENCSGGGHIKDFGIASRTHYTVATDTLSNLADRQSLWDGTHALPPMILQAYTYDDVYPIKGDTPNAFLWRSAMMGAWQIAPTDTARWTPAQLDETRRCVAIYRDWIRPTLRDSQVHHILPRPDGLSWDGMFTWSPSLRRGTVYVFRPDAPGSVRTIPLKGLEAAKSYWVWGEEGSVRPAESTGAALMTAGLRVRLPARYTSDIIYVRDAGLGKPDEIEAPAAFHLADASVTSDYFAARATLSWQPSSHARSYRLQVAATPDFAEPLIAQTVYGPSALLPKLPASGELHWRVQAVSPGGARWNDGGAGTFQTPALQVLKGITFASDMKWVRSSAGADNVVHRDTNYLGNPISVAGKAFPKGLWTHAYNDATPADIVFDIAGKGFARFRASVGVDDAANGGTVQFQVLLDGAVKAETPVMRLGAVHAFDVDVSAAREVTLRVTNGGDGFECDHSAWGMARFLDNGAEDLSF